MVLEMARAYSAAERALHAIAKKKKKEKDKASEATQMKALALAEVKRLETHNHIALSGLGGQDAGAVLTLTPEAAAAGGDALPLDAEVEVNCVRCLGWGEKQVRPGLHTVTRRSIPASAYGIHPTDRRPGRVIVYAIPVTLFHDSDCFRRRGLRQRGCGR